MLAEPPSNGGYLVAAYVVTPVILVGYWLRLLVKAKQIRSVASSSRVQRGT